MIDQANLRNPLRWYLVVLLIGIVASLGVGDPFKKFQVQRFAELLPALLLLAWSYRRQPQAFFTQPASSGWYGLGLVGFALAALGAGLFGAIPWISMGFLGLALLQFSLLPLIQPLWQRYGADSVRILALFGLAVLGIDVGILFVAHFGGLTAYSWVIRFLPNRALDEFPYLFLNSRWANQVALVVMWVFLPLLRQLRLGEIRCRRSFWRVVCGAIPLLAMVQFVFTAGRGVLLASLLAVLALWLWSRRLPRGDRSDLVLAVLLLVASLLAALLLNLVVAQGGFFFDVALRNAQELAPLSASSPGHSADSATPVGVSSEIVDKRSVLWAAFGRGIWGESLQGQGIPLVAPRAPACTPHNLWLALLYWTGLLGAGFAALLSTGFVPLRQRLSGAGSMALPLLVSLFVYQLVDDIWLRSLAVAVLLVVLPALKQPVSMESLALQPRWLRVFAFPAVTYRFLALVGVLLISLSIVIPGGIGFGPSSLVSVPGRTCMLFF